jgi:hypothetical protein
MHLSLQNLRIAAVFIAGLSLLFTRLRAEESRKQSPEMSDVVGRVFLTLSKDSTVSGQNFDEPSLWVNAKLGHVQRTSRGGQQGPMETEMAPTASGIVLHFYGVYSLNAVQKEWSTLNDKKNRTLEILVELPGGRFIGITGAFGQFVPQATIDDLLSLAMILPENHPAQK